MYYLDVFEKKEEILGYSMKPLCILLSLAAAFAVSTSAFCTEPELQKTWRFRGREGGVEIKLTRFVHGDGTKVTSLEIYSPDAAPRDVEEEGKFFASVLDDLSKAGFNLKSLDSILSRFNEPDAVKRVAVYAASSKQWRGALKTYQPSVYYPLVTSFLNESHAYQEWDSVFKSHGLALKVAGVEEVLVEPFSKVGASCPVAADCSNLLVPSDAFVQMNIMPSRSQ